MLYSRFSLVIYFIHRSVYLAMTMLLIGCVLMINSLISLSLSFLIYKL